jgi:hypothetical protein
MILHVDGTTAPKALALPEHLKAHVYLPPNLLAEFVDSHETIAQIVQSFIEVVGVPTVIRWRRAAVSTGWSLSQQQSGTYSTPSNVHLPLIPAPIQPTSSYYIFPGRPSGSLQSVSEPSSPDTHFSVLSGTHENSQGSRHDEDHCSLYEDQSSELARLLGENRQLREQLRQAEERNAANEVLVANL